MTRLLVLYAVVLSLTLPSCGPARTTTVGAQTSRDGRAITVNGDNSISLTDYLRRLPGVSVAGNGPAASVSIRGLGSLSLSNEPLFVVDNIPLGAGIASVYSAVTVADIAEIRVVSSPADLALYGLRGANGVIEITTRTQ